MKVLCTDGDLQTDVTSIKAAMRQQSSAERFLLTRQGILRAVELCLSGKVEFGNLQVWADTIEGNDLVQYEDSHQAAIADALFLLSSPVVGFEELNDVALDRLRSLLA